MLIFYNKSSGRNAIVMFSHMLMLLWEIESLLFKILQLTLSRKSATFTVNDIYTGMESLAMVALGKVDWVLPKVLHSWGEDTSSNQSLITIYCVSTGRESCGIITKLHILCSFGLLLLPQHCLQLSPAWLNAPVSQGRQWSPEQLFLQASFSSSLATYHNKTDSSSF